MTMMIHVFVCFLLIKGANDGVQSNNNGIRVLFSFIHLNNTIVNW